MTKERRYTGLRAVAGPLSAVTRPIFRRRGLATVAIAREWPSIVGAELARQTIPERYAPDRQGGGTLSLRVAGGWATQVQHLEPQIVERINAFFGYRAVSRLALRQGPIPASQSRPGDRAATPADPASKQAILARVAAIRDPDLREALGRLAEAVTTRPNQDKKT